MKKPIYILAYTTALMAILNLSQILANSSVMEFKNCSVCISAINQIPKNFTIPSLVIDNSSTFTKKTLSSYTSYESIKVGVNSSNTLSVSKPNASTIVAKTNEFLITPTYTIDADKTSLTPAATDEKKEKNIYLFGDSLMGEVGFALKGEYKKSSKIKIHLLHKVSTGLTNDTYYNWPQEAKGLLPQNKDSCDAVFVLLGANDAQPIRNSTGAWQSFGTTAWQNEYSQRVESFLSILNQQCNGVYIIELPFAASSRGDFAKKIDVIHNLQSQISSKGKAQYLELPREIQKNIINFRVEDGIHLNTQGSKLLAKKLTTLIDPVEVSRTN